jgi:hypothetical protein
MQKLEDARHYRVATVSQLWQRGFLGTWTAAQFGNQVQGAKMYCHLLEWNADISPEEQNAVAQVANRYSFVSDANGLPVQGPGYAGISLAAFEPGSSSKEKEQHLLAWAACRRVQTDVTGSADNSANGWTWRAEPAWAALGNDHGMTDEGCKWYFEQNESLTTQIQNAFAKNLDDGTTEALDTGCGFGGWLDAVKTIGTAGANCGLAAWNGTVNAVPLVGKYFSTATYTQKIGDFLGNATESSTIDRTGSVKPLSFDSESDVRLAVDNAVSIPLLDRTGEDCAAAVGTANDCAAASISGYTNAKEAGKTILALKGFNPVQRLSLSLLALVTALVYVYAIGFLALGTFLAKFGLILLIILLPVTLVLLAIPSASGSTSQTGKKMLRLTGGFVLSHGLLSFVLGLLLSTMLMFEALIGGSGGFVHALIPLAALFVVRKLLQTAGLGDLLNAQGALGMPLAASLGAAGKDWQAAGMNKFNNATGGEKIDPVTGERTRRGLSRLDAAAKRAGMAIPKASGRAAKWAGRKTSDRLALPERRTQLLGRRDADGNLVEFGLAQRMKSLAGLMDMAKGNRFTGATANALLGTAAGKKFDSFARSNRFARAVGNSESAKAQMERRRQMISEVTFKSKEQRTVARKEYAADMAEELRAKHLALRDASGEIIRDPSGKAVFGYRHATQLTSRLGTGLVDHEGRAVFAAEDLATGQRLPSGYNFDSIPDLAAQKRADGSLITGRAGRQVFGWAHDDGTGSRVLDWDEYQALSPAEKSNSKELYSKDAMKKGVRYVHDEITGASIIDNKQLDKLSITEKARALGSAITDPSHSFLSDSELEAHARHFSETFALRPGQSVFSRVGFNGIISPVLGDASNHNRFVITKNMETSEDLASMYRVQFLANQQKARPKGFTDDQYSAYLHMVEEYFGGYDDHGAKTDVILDELGFARDSARGSEQIKLALSGQNSELDKIQYELSPDIYQSFVAAASGFSPRNERKAIYQDISAARHETMASVQIELSGEQERINTGGIQLEAYQVQMRTESAKLKAVRANIGQLNTDRTAYSDVEVEVAGIDNDITGITSQIAALRVSSNPADKVTLLTKQTALVNLEKLRKAREDALTELQRAVNKGMASQAEWLDEERRSYDEVKRVADEISKVSSGVFESSKRAEELGKQMEFAFKAFRHDRGKEDWSVIDDSIDDWVKGHNNKWATDGRDLRSLEDAFQQAVSRGEEVHMRKAFDEISSKLNQMGRSASRSSASGAAYHGYIVNELAKLEGNMRHAVETNPAVIPWSRENYMELS